MNPDAVAATSLRYGTMTNTLAMYCAPRLGCDRLRQRGASVRFGRRATWCCGAPPHRLPEPTRLADRLVALAKRELG